jgi:indolepyruvate ferredoxin oxidoreductase beta subunit
MLVGVGGQGVVLASEIIVTAAHHNGLDVKKSEVHGMSQRGGVVTSHVRYGPKVYSPLVESGNTDIILAFEAAEALRFCHQLKPEGFLYTSPYTLIPPIAGKKHKYPENPLQQIKNRVKNLVVLDAVEIAQELGNPRLANSVFLGALSPNSGISDEHWEYAIQKLAPKKTGPANLQAFYRGCEIVCAKSNNNIVLKR